MSAGGEIARVIGLYELRRARSLPAGLEIYVRALESDGDEAGLDLMAEEARAAERAYGDLAHAATQASISVAAAATHPAIPPAPEGVGGLPTATDR